MRVAVLKEREVGESRVALVPETVGRLVQKGLTVLVEKGAGLGACFPDLAYEEAGAQVVGDPLALLAEADVVLKVAPPQETEVHLLHPGAVLISFVDPLGRPLLVKDLAKQGVTTFSMEMIPRTSRAQGMDALSSQASLAGYKAVLIAAANLPKFFPMLTTAAGTIPPAKVFIIGAGVAGLQAIATARRLGAVVEAFDIRPQVKEEVQSLGAKFVEVALAESAEAGGGYAREVSEDSKEKSRQLISDHVARADVVITTAQVPGKKAPLLVTEEMVAQMKPGSVIIDLAAAQGGNCAGIEAGHQVVKGGVTLIGSVNLPASMPIHASQMYSKNLFNVLNLLIPDHRLHLDFDDDIIQAACVTHGGEIRSQRVKDALAQELVA
ncbi:nicotinamide nucleotide transhydrogenase, subunit alpha [Gloeomargarita lithophora Alchichica-D10]|uniref:NAD(P) transhydrogenase subunit alpha part 1 n=1 Tax=Gloeomargarita lithophora Alchichica-D10 TaxID=1188229 RepID=A0A1J0ADF5_9CYAN|nr:Re/Si-specific NAD(P)(+) transhydrogenase subunit alpha [Gloeomargarita lithophora]APB33970.1 nicotinamide nucleotide transhydrogenase, subunit alpha [Gloeomargarita lithophora Alchichica-D10]